ncbi:hypothetical protein SCLCIDRAFT_16254 [Scleroderma citrinum Foug A]|uniref:ZIP-like iron-zinc transporter n=1 Tax=Scleroderma citrinum Foug A TaxID=1036808 RepID=A0A0C3DWY8_9AGAM|nr:hypothetical protein SCLCIDRAFT_16254 [Scleroderma citrinum Foug A]
MSDCEQGGDTNSYIGLRVASIFIILVGSGMGALFPVLAKKSSWLRVPDCVFDFAKYFGSGVIIATAFIHLLSPALGELGSPCLSPAWSEYPYALALAMLSLFSIFIVELVSFRWGTTKLSALNVAHATEIIASEGGSGEASLFGKTDPKPAAQTTVVDGNVLAQIVGLIILEFGLLLHSFLIGLTLAVSPAFKVLFIVIVFHQTFEGLGLGARLAQLKLSVRYRHVTIFAALLFAISTPVGIAIGLGVRETYNPRSATASIVSGVMDSLSAGILLYTGLVELLAHEFLFNKEMSEASDSKVAYAVICMLFGSVMMAFLGKWA